MKHIPPSWLWMDYSNVPPCIEMCAEWDDALKKESDFCNYAVLLAQEILGKSWKVRPGKWGARLVTGKDNAGKTRQEFEEAAERVRIHPAWLALTLSTHIFTYGK